MFWRRRERSLPFDRTYLGWGYLGALYPQNARQDGSQLLVEVVVHAGGVVHILIDGVIVVGGLAVIQVRVLGLQEVLVVGGAVIDSGSAVGDDGKDGVVRLGGVRFYSEMGWLFQTTLRMRPQQGVAPAS